jgi:hypothetical protein
MMNKEPDDLIEHGVDKEKKYIQNLVQQTITDGQRMNLVVILQIGKRHTDALIVLQNSHLKTVAIRKIK